GRDENSAFVEHEGEGVFEVVADRYAREERGLGELGIGFAQPLAAFDLNPIGIAQVNRADEVKAVRNRADLVAVWPVEFRNGVGTNAPEAERIKRDFILLGCTDWRARISGNHLLTGLTQRATRCKRIAYGRIKLQIIDCRSRGSQAQ